MRKHNYSPFSLSPLASLTPCFPPPYFRQQLIVGLLEQGHALVKLKKQELHIPQSLFGGDGGGGRIKHFKHQAFAPQQPVAIHLWVGHQNFFERVVARF